MKKRISRLLLAGATLCILMGMTTVVLAKGASEENIPQIDGAGGVSSSIEFSVVNEPVNIHEVDVTVEYLDGALPEETRSYMVEHGKRFEQKVDVREGYILANRELLTFPGLEYDEDTGVISLDPVEAPIRIVLKFEQAQYRVDFKITYLDSSRVEGERVDWIWFDQSYLRPYELPEGYEIANGDALLQNGIQIDYEAQILRIDKVRKDYDIHLELQKKSHRVVIKVIYEDDPGMNVENAWDILYGEPFYGEFIVREDCVIKKITFNVYGISIDCVENNVTINRITEDVEVTVIVRSGYVIAEKDNKKGI